MDDGRVQAQPLVPAAVALAAGMAAVCLPAARWPLVAAAAAAYVVAGRARVPASWTAVVALWALVGAARMLVWVYDPDAAWLRQQLSDEPQPAAIHGVVEELLPALRPGTARCIVKLRDAAQAGRWSRAGGRLEGRLRGGQPAPGDEVLAEGAWCLVPEAGNPGQYNRRAALARRGVSGLFTNEAARPVVILARADPGSLTAQLAKLRLRCEALLERFGAPRPDVAALLVSALLGERRALDAQTQRAFVETGTIHLLVVSGFNIGLMAVLAEWLLRLLGVSWRVRWLGNGLFLTVYAGLTGADPPVVRATVMAWLALCATALDRIVCWPNVIAAAVLGILLLDPANLLDPSCQLSFGAVISLVLFSGNLARAFDRALSWVGWKRGRQALSVGLSATVAVWIGLWPVLAWYFFQLSPGSVLANLVLAPLMTALVWLGVTALLLGLVAQPLACWAPAIVGTLGAGILTIVRWLHGWLPAWFIGRPPLWVLLGYYALLALTLVGRSRRWPATRLAAVWCVSLACGVGVALAGRIEARRWLVVEFLDVGHGDAIHVRLPSGRHWLIDAGPEHAGASRVIPALRSQGVGRLDALILTHQDEDHIGGALPLLLELPVSRVLTNGAWGDTMASERLRETCRRGRIAQHALSAGMRLEDVGVRMDVLHPPASQWPAADAAPSHADKLAAPSGASAGGNNQGLVLRLRYGAVQFLLTGDVEDAGLAAITSARLPLTVLKAPHHGSRLGPRAQEAITRLRPDVAVISGATGRGLPAADTVRLLHGTGAWVYRTDRHGHISMRTDGARLDVAPVRGRMAGRRTDPRGSGR